MAALLLDENVPRAVGAALTAAGHDVAFVAALEAGADDRRVLALARAGGRMLVTFDADYGELVFQQGLAAPPAILYLRLHPARAEVAATLVSAALDADPGGHFVVASPDGVRRRPLPSEAARDGPG